MRGNSTIKILEERNGMVSTGTKEWKVMTCETHRVGATENSLEPFSVCLSTVS